MRYVISLLSFLLLTVNVSKCQLKSAICFANVGRTTAVFKPLIICDHKIILPFMAQDRRYLSIATGKYTFTKTEIELYFKNKYDTVLTSAYTFSIVGNFIVNHPKYLTNGKNQIDNLGTPSFHVLYKEVEYKIYSKRAKEFLLNLTKCLKETKSDSNIIKKIANFKWQSRYE